MEFSYFAENQNVRRVSRRKNGKTLRELKAGVLRSFLMRISIKVKETLVSNS